jgi:hypothetical protein
VAISEGDQSLIDLVTALARDLDEQSSELKVVARTQSTITYSKPPITTPTEDGTGPCRAGLSRACDADAVRFDGIDYTYGDA